MLGAVRAVFGPSRADRRRAAAAYLDKLRTSLPGETLACSDIIKDYEAFSDGAGAPRLRPDDLLAELAALGCKTFDAIRVPWPVQPDGEAAALPPPTREAPPAPKARPKAPRAPRGELRGTSAQSLRALSDLQDRLARGDLVPSQKMLAEAWGVRKSTASEWLKAWEAAKLIPRRQRSGHCNIIVLPERRVREVA